jgi:hypothetical protein
MKRHILHNLLLLVHLALGDRHILLRLEIELRSVGVGPSHALASARVGLDVDDISHRNALLLNSLIDTRIQPQLLHPLRTLQPNQQRTNRLSITPQRVLRLFRRQLRHLSLIHLLRLSYAEADRAPEVLHQRLCLLHFCAVHFAPDDGAEGNFRA